MLVKLTDASNGDDMWVNPKMVMCVTKRAPMHNFPTVTIELPTENCLLYARGTLDEVAAKLNGEADNA